MKHVVLVGMMGVGKSTVGRYLAARLERPFIDTDSLIEKQEGAAIAQIFASKGESYFRQLEIETIQKILNEPSAVISIGGGAFISPVVRFLLKDPAVTFYLQAKAETLIQRVGNGATRPMLTHGVQESVPDRFRRLLAERASTYELANHTIESDTLSPEQVGDAILKYRTAFE